VLSACHGNQGLAGSFLEVLALGGGDDAAGLIDEEDDD
jgi:hypothetical protein